MDAPSTQNRPGRAVALKIAGVFLIMVMAALIKAATQEVPPWQAVFFRSFFAIPIIAIWLVRQGNLREGLSTKNPKGHFWRGLIGSSAMALTFSGLTLLPLPEVTAIGYATPIFTVLFAAIFLGERIRMIRISAVALGLVGVMVVMWPRLGTADLSDTATLGALMVLGASVLRALVQIHVRQLVQTEHTAAIVFWFSITASTLSLFTIPLGWVWPSSMALGLLICAGLIGGVAQILITSSYRFGAAGMLAPFDYTSMIFAILIGWVVFSELPTAVMLMGSALVIAGGALIIWRERQLGLSRGKARHLVDPKG
ncbi:MAG: DMT family transporter [Paracoccaceae bacterium]